MTLFCSPQPHDPDTGQARDQKWLTWTKCTFGAVHKGFEGVAIADTLSGFGGEAALAQPYIHSLMVSYE